MANPAHRFPCCTALIWCVLAFTVGGTAADKSLPWYIAAMNPESAGHPESAGRSGPEAGPKEPIAAGSAHGEEPDGLSAPLVPSPVRASPDRLSRSVKPGEPYRALTIRQKARLQLLTTFQPETLTRVAVTAGLATLRDSPNEWPRTVEAYQWRFADRIGQRLVFKQVQFTVGSVLLGEDPRYFLSEDRGKWGRVKSAFKQTWAVRRNNGSWAPAYGTFAGAYAASVVSSRWQPERRQQWDSVLMRGSSQIGFQFCNHLVREFLPDIKKAFRR
ncbi:MAG: hypothetical protein MUF01_07535 [Bryobacterales bacterium]|jgi:hypothetical protein|nr:hypothetical protein [Bryobacterales bacterium]